MDSATTFWPANGTTLPRGRPDAASDVTPIANKTIAPATNHYHAHDDMTQVLRSRVLYLYKELLYMGKDYPQGYDFFRQRLSKVFKKNRAIDDPAEIEKKLEHGEYIKKELVALYTLRTYRSVKNRYYE